jgi:murein DD-endopeptidase MepM/ murein hydrolase activator NlpD
VIDLIVVGVLVQEPSPGHDAWDIACRRGASVHAVFDGTMHTSYNSRMGNQVTLKGGRTAYYAHLDTVKAQGFVKKGDVIGTCGSTGAWSTGNHVHFELH